MSRILLCLLCLLLPLAVQAESRQVEITASGASRAAAITEALIEAVSEVRGVDVNAVQDMRSAMVSATSDDQHSASVSETSTSDIARVTRGAVESYQLLDMTEDPPGHFTAHVLASLPIFTSTANADRRRIAVAPFGDGAGGRGDGARLGDALSAALTQSRRFAVLDRANGGAYAAELGLANAAPLADQTRLDQVLMTDYIVTGTLHQTRGTRSVRVIGLTGERVVTSTPGSVEADFQVIDFATRQVKLAGKVGPGGSASESINALAVRIAEQITQAIYPMRLINVVDPKALVINQGGGTVHAGQHFRAMLLGEMMVDPYTKEPLGQAESEIGLVEITHVDEKLSYARLISGTLPPAGANVVLRPAPAPRPRQAAPARPAPPPVIKLPGDP
jgi:curli biogenesis system outer membrane secretion channel CsgG